MAEVMSSFKYEIFTHVSDSISQVCQDFEPAVEPTTQDDQPVVTALAPSQEQSADSLIDRVETSASGLVYTIPDYFLYSINFHSDGKIRGCLHYTVLLRSEVIHSQQKLVLIAVMYWNIFITTILSCY